jgi:hypothetical protein
MTPDWRGDSVHEPTLGDPAWIFEVDPPLLQEMPQRVV